MVNVQNFTIKDFESILAKTEDRNIVCFCAGQAFLTICDRYPLLAGKVLYIVDNYIESSWLEVKGRIIPIRKMEQIGEEVKEKILLICSLKFADELVQQMDQIPVLEQCNVYIPNLFVNDSRMKFVPSSNPVRIPKKIHYCWFGHGEMPKQFKDNIETWKKFCPEYEIVRWDESNYDISKNEYMRQAYEMKKWGFVPDYARLDIVYEHGGIYLDTDVELVRSLDELLKYKLFCGFESMDYVAFGLGFGAQKNHPILKHMMEEYDKEKFILEDGTLNLVASPVYQTRVLEKYGLKKNGHMQEYADFVVFPTECFAPVNAYGVGYPKSNTFSIHQYAATWFDESQKKHKERIIKSCKYLVDRLNSDQ